MPEIKRIEPGRRFSEAVVCDGVVYISGQVDLARNRDPKVQTAEVLKTIDDLLAKAGKDRRVAQVFEIWWSEGCCGFIAGRGVHTRPNLNPATVAAYLVVGNIYDNPELLFDQAEQANRS